MPKRDKFIGAWVSEEEKNEIANLAKGMNTSISDMIRHRVNRPMMTIPEAIQNLKLYFDNKFSKFELKMIGLVKTQKNEPIKRRTMIIEEEYIPIKSLPQPEIIIPLNAESSSKLEMKKVLAEMSYLVRSGKLILKKPPTVEIYRARARTDPINYNEFKARKKK